MRTISMITTRLRQHEQTVWRRRPHRHVRRCRCRCQSWLVRLVARPFVGRHCRLVSRSRSAQSSSIFV